MVLLVIEEQTELHRAQLEQDPGMVVWWTAPGECESALQWRMREGVLDTAGVRAARARLSF
ncbi:MAG: hypothetical protein NZ739_10875 [Verrucomicrobiae bacterium]|nr:hypothetical protein [Verrucomicrobiae bacterium]MCX7722556.1 hypothetical protein [Verrucomicrobiae bacterium]MDW7979811.1 hypothetical protein [Verrucomicrobiales bacterium]